MKKFVLGAAIASALLTTAALAADLPVIPAKSHPLAGVPVAAPVYNWTGFYLGLNAGYGAENVQQTTAANDVVGGVLAGLIPGNLETAPRGPAFGGQFGYRQQLGWLVLGAEEMIDWAHITSQSNASSNLSAVAPGVVASSSAGQQIDWVSFSNVVVGVVPSPHFMTYLTGGLAVAGVNTNSGAAVTGLTTGSQSIDQTRVGWDAGLGFEFAVNSNITLRADARYYDLGTVNGAFSTSNGAAGPVTIDFSQPTRGYLGTVGLNYKF